MIAPLSYPNPLAGNPKGLAFPASVTEKDGSSLEVACPTMTRLSLACMNMNAVLGGAACHWGGPSAYAEIMSSIHAIMFKESPWFDSYNFVNDAGHAENGIYALKANYNFAGVDYEGLKGFRSIQSKLTGHGESHLFADGVMISNGPLASGLPIAQGLAMADKQADSKRTTICVISDGAMMEGEAKEAAAAIPGFAAKGEINPFVMVVSDNNTKLSGRIDEQSFSMVPTFESLKALGWDVRLIEEGHDLQTVFSAIEDAKNDASTTKAVALWVKTVKGKAVKATEEAASGGHGYPLGKPEQVQAFCEEIADGKELPAIITDWIKELNTPVEKESTPSATSDLPKGKIQAGFADGMIKGAEAGLPVINIGADVQGSTGVAPFNKAFPKQSICVGIAESNMMSVAAGFSKIGYIPVVDAFAQFGVTKGALPLCMASLSQSPMIAVFSHAGFQDAADGASHQALSYLAMTSSIPDVQVYCPATSEEAAWAMEAAITKFAEDRKAGKTPKSTVFFCGRENFPKSLTENYSWGKAQIIKDTTDGKDKKIVISANSGMTTYALDAVAELEKENIGVVLINSPIPNAPDIETHKTALEKCDNKLITVDDHQAIGGAGSMLVTELLEAGVKPTLKLLGVRGEFGQSAYLATELYDKFGVGPKAMIEAAKTI